MNQSFTKLLGATILATSLMAQPAMASSAGGQEPNAVEMGADLIIARPVQLAATGIGAVVFLASLPFTVLGDNVGQAGKTLVAAPAKATFARCLGCVK
ncbi:MAG: multidrug transporter [Gammaproteobacteria bacterium]